MKADTTVLGPQTEEKKKLVIHIGLATIVYNGDNKIIEAMFDPTLKVKDCKDLVTALEHIEGPIEKQAELVVASWFARVSTIELADREKWHMVATLLPDLDMPNPRYPDGSKGKRSYYTLEQY